MNVVSAVWDARDALRYLEDVKSEFADDLLALRHFLQIVYRQIWTGSSLFDLERAIFDATSILKASPKLLYGFNSLLCNGYRIECRIDVEQVEFFVLCVPDGARILSCMNVEVPEPSCTRNLRAFLASECSCEVILSRNTNISWLGCLSQLLQVVVSDKGVHPRERRKAFQFLYVLAKRSILPPSLFLNDVKPDPGFALSGGGFADIYKGRSRDMAVCLKVIRMFSTPPEAREKAYKAFTREALVWKQLDHPNVLPFLGASEQVFASRYCLISPWMRNGNIMAYLERHPDHDRLTSIREIVEGVRYLHRLDPPITHKDIKGANVLIKDNLVCCLADFGLASVIESQRISTSNRLEGSIPWLAPEIIDPGRFPGQKPGLPGDVYALGSTIYEICTGKPPFAEINGPTTIMFEVVINGKRPSLPPIGYRTTQLEEIWSLVAQCWLANPDERPNIEAVQKILKGIANPVHEENQIFPSVSGSDDIGSPEHADHRERSKITEWLRRELAQGTFRKSPRHSSFATASVPNVDIRFEPMNCSMDKTEAPLVRSRTRRQDTEKRLEFDAVKFTKQLPTPVTPCFGNPCFGNVVSEGGETFEDQTRFLPSCPLPSSYGLTVPETRHHFHPSPRHLNSHHDSSPRSLLTPPITPRPKSTFWGARPHQLPPTPNSPSYDSKQLYSQTGSSSAARASTYTAVELPSCLPSAGQRDKHMTSANEALPNLRLLSIHANVQGPTPPSTPLRESGFPAQSGLYPQYAVASQLKRFAGVDHRNTPSNSVGGRNLLSEPASQGELARVKRGYHGSSPLCQLSSASSGKLTSSNTYESAPFYSADAINNGFSHVAHSATNNSSTRKFGSMPITVPFVPLVEDSESE